MKLLYNFLAISTVGILFTSCLKDKNVVDEVYGMKNYDQGKIIELPSPPNHFHAIGLDLKNADTTFNVVAVGLAADGVAQEDIRVTLTLAGSQAIITDYNTANTTSFQMLPTNLYRLNGNGIVVTIPKGSRYGYVSVTLNPNNLDPSVSYGLGFRIASVETSGYTLSRNFGTVMVGIVVKNRYDGVYNLRMKHLGWLAFGIGEQVFNWGGPVFLESSGAATVKLFDDWGFGAYIQPAIQTSGTLTGFGQTEPKFEFDLITNKLVRVTNDLPNPTNGRQFAINPAVTDSRWDPATRKVYAAYLLTQPGRPTLFLYDTLTYVGPRP
jgi:hypothetical protein